MHADRWTSRRARAMPVNTFQVMDEARCAAAAAGHEIIDLSVGSSDLPAPAAATDALRSAALRRETHGYCLHSGTRPFREAAAAWFARRYGGRLDPESEVLALIGAQEGYAHLLLAVTDPGDLILVPDPGYPSWFGAIAIAGLDAHHLPLREDRGYLPDLTAIPGGVARRARALTLSYPNNPTAAVAPRAFLAEAVEFCRAHDILLVHDFPYVDLVFGDYEAPSVLSLPGALDVAVELYSCSKSWHMGGFRIGWAAGRRDAIAALRRVKGAIDFGPYLGIQEAGIAALALPRDETRRTARVFEERRDALVRALNDAGWATPLPRASMYVWTRLPDGHTDSFAFAVDLARRTGVCLAPGRAFGPGGEGYVRFALVRDPETLRTAVTRLCEGLGAR